jgi:hypothetical protein
MAKVLATCISLALSGAIATSAWAIDFRGSIKKIDQEANVIRLSNGVDLYYDETVDENTLKEGLYIKADCKKIKGRFVIKRLKVVSD